MHQPRRFGASADIHWDVRELTRPDGSCTPNLIGAREAVPRLLGLFREGDIAATWATFGFLIAKSRDELEAFSPAVKPEYIDPVLSLHTVGIPPLVDALGQALDRTDAYAARPMRPSHRPTHPTLGEHVGFECNW